KPLLDDTLRKAAADEHQPGFPLLVRLPWTLMVTFDQHVDTLDDKTLVVVRHRDDALHPQDVGSERLRDILDPGDELLRIHRTIGRERQAADRLIVLVVVLLGEKARLDVEDAIDIESIAAEHLGEIDIAPS